MASYEPTAPSSTMNTRNYFSNVNAAPLDDNKAHGTANNGSSSTNNHNATATSHPHPPSSRPPPAPLINPIPQDQLSKMDIVCGRGTLAYKQEGNHMFRQLVSAYRFQYNAFGSSQRKAKTNMARQLVLLLQTKYGARFVQRVDEDDNNNKHSKSSDSDATKWTLLSLSEAAKKVSHALRNVRPRSTERPTARDLELLEPWPEVECPAATSTKRKTVDRTKGKPKIPQLPQQQQQLQSAPPVGGQDLAPKPWDAHFPKSTLDEEQQDEKRPMKKPRKAHSPLSRKGSSSQSSSPSSEVPLPFDEDWHFLSLVVEHHAVLRAMTRHYQEVQQQKALQQQQQLSFLII